MLAKTGRCAVEPGLHPKCTHPSWGFVCHLSFKDEPGEIDHTQKMTEFQQWFYSWDRSLDENVYRLCEISWNASRAMLVGK